MNARDDLDTYRSALDELGRCRQRTQDELEQIVAAASRDLAKAEARKRDEVAAARAVAARVTDLSESATAHLRRADLSRVLSEEVGAPPGGSATEHLEAAQRLISELPAEVNAVLAERKGHERRRSEEAAREADRRRDEAAQEAERARRSARRRQVVVVLVIVLLVLAIAAVVVF